MDGVPGTESTAYLYKMISRTRGTGRDEFIRGVTARHGPCTDASTRELSNVTLSSAKLITRCSRTGFDYRPVGPHLWPWYLLENVLRGLMLFTWEQAPVRCRVSPCVMSRGQSRGLGQINVAELSVSVFTHRLATTTRFGRGIIR